ncbi:MAG: extracellular solute-binding protein [Dehalococcoidia bacterium]
MLKRRSIYRRAVTRRRAILGMLSILMVALLVAAACGEEATPTPVPATSTPQPGATATPIIKVVTPTPVPTGLRPRSEWTVDNPATLGEIEAELEQYRGKSLVFVSWGGAFQAAQRQAHLIPFESKFGIQIIEESPVSAPKTRAQAETGNVTWHVVSLGSDSFYRLGNTDNLEDLDKSVVDTRNFFKSIAGNPWSGGGGETWTLVLAFNTDSVNDRWGGREPTSWADAYDVENFPGTRSWSIYWNENLVSALLSEDPSLLDTPEGRASLSPLSAAQIDHAFEILSDFKPDITHFWSAGSECPQLLIAGEMDMCMAWNGRIFDAQQEGAPIKIAWEAGHMMATEAFAIPKGLKAQDPEQFEIAQLFIAWTSLPVQNARIARFISYGPVNKDSVAALDASVYDYVRAELPSSAANIDYAIEVDEKWLGDIYDEIEERFQAFLQE